MIRYDLPMRKALAVSSREKKGQEVSCLFSLLSVLTYFIKGFAVMKATKLFLLTAFVRRIPKCLPRRLSWKSKTSYQLQQKLCDENSTVKFEIFHFPKHMIDGKHDTICKSVMFLDILFNSSSADTVTRLCVMVRLSGKTYIPVVLFY